MQPLFVMYFGRLFQSFTLRTDKITSDRVRFQAVQQANQLLQFLCVYETAD